MLGLISLFIVVITSLLITRIATVMLTLTGLSRESSQFQARSAFSGAGFTTAESETVVNHPVRRRIIMGLILWGNAGVVTALVSLLLSFGGVANPSQAATRLLLLALGLGIVWIVSRSKPASRALERLIEVFLRRFTDLDTRDYIGLLRLSDHWVVAELEVEENDWLCNVPLGDLALPEEGILVLGIERTDGRWVGAPAASTILHPRDVAVLYGTQDAIDRLDHRHHDMEGELDRIASQVDFTEQYLEQQEQERAIEDQEADEVRRRPRLDMGRLPEEAASPEPSEPDSD